jgi:hypothetical protein
MDGSCAAAASEQEIGSRKIGAEQRLAKNVSVPFR